jgi:hypothetical protein
MEIEMNSIFDVVKKNLEHKNESEETLQLWADIWSIIEKKGIDYLEDYLAGLLESPEDD